MVIVSLKLIIAYLGILYKGLITFKIIPYKTLSTVLSLRGILI